MARSLSKGTRSHNAGRGTRSGTNHGTYRWSRKNVEDVTAKASVDTARKGPVPRRAGKPTRKAAAAATSTPAGRARKRSTRWLARSTPVVAGPKPAKAKGPRERDPP